MKKKYPKSLFLIGFFMNFFISYFIFFISGALLLIAGIFERWCLYAGIILLLIDALFSFVKQIRMKKELLSETGNEDFQKFRDAVFGEGDAIENIRRFVEESMPEYPSEYLTTSAILRHLNMLREKDISMWIYMLTRHKN